MFTTVEIDCSKIHSFADLHAVFKGVMGFPDFYGNNMNAWIDCMTSVDCPEDGMTTVHVEKGGFMILVLRNVDEMISSCPAVYTALVDDVAFVNHRRLAAGEPPVLGLAYHANPNR